MSINVQAHLWQDRNVEIAVSTGAGVICVSLGDVDLFLSPVQFANLGYAIEAYRDELELASKPDDLGPPTADDIDCDRYHRELDKRLS